MSNKYVKMNYCEIFQPEIKPFLTEENIEKDGSQNKSLKDAEFIERNNKEFESKFYEKGGEGLNDDSLCELIPNNQIEEFVRFTERRN